MWTSSIFKHFPPPEFLNPPRIGVSFSDASIKAVAFGNGTKKFPVVSALVHLEEGTVVNGSVKNKEKLIAKLKEIKEVFDSPFVYFTIPDELTYIYKSTINVVPGKDATENIAFTIEENIPLSLQDTIFDFIPTTLKIADGKYEADIAVAACQKIEIEKLTEIIKASGLEPVGCVHESQAIAGALISKEAKTLNCIVHVREDRIGLFLAKGGAVSFATLRPTSSVTYIEDYKDELFKVKEYHERFESVPLPVPIEQIVVCGEFEYAKKIVAAHNEMPDNNTKAKLGNVWTNVFEIDEHTPTMPYEKSLSFAGSIGALLASF